MLIPQVGMLKATEGATVFNSLFSSPGTEVSSGFHLTATSLHFSFPPSLFASIHPLSDFSMQGSLKIVCVLHMESFVELSLFSLL